MNLKKTLFAVLFFTLLSPSVHASGMDQERLQGFAEHQSEEKRFDESRAHGERAYLEESEQWEVQMKKDRDAYMKEPKPTNVDDDGADARTDEAEKAQWKKAYEKDKKAYELEQKQNRESFTRGKNGIPTEEQEYGLLNDRPRYDYKKRASFTGQAMAGRSTDLSPGGSSGRVRTRPGGRNNNRGGSNDGLPAPPSFPDFGNDNGYVPPPPPASMDDFGEVPAAPPPPPPAYQDDNFNNGGQFYNNNGNGDFVPAPNLDENAPIF